MDNQQPGYQEPTSTPPSPTPEATQPLAPPQEPMVTPVEQPAVTQPVVTAPVEPVIDLSQPAVAPPMFTAPTDPMPTPIYAQPVAQMAVPQKDPGHGLGLASLILSITGFGLIGIILGFVAISKSKKSGHKSNTLGLVGVILGFVTMIASAAIVFVLFSNAGDAAKKVASSVDTNMVTKTNMLHSKLEVYYDDNGSYPNIIATGTLPGIDISTLETADGTSMRMISANNRDEALATTAPTADNPYIYVSFDCASTACKGYLIKTFIANPTDANPNPYVKEGLNNP